LKALGVIVAAAIAVAIIVSGSPSLWQQPAAQEVTLLNVSFDPTRELYQDINTVFAQHWLATRGQRVTIKQSHGGSGKQARAVIDGLRADVVTLALGADIDAIVQKSGRVDAQWQSALPNNAVPFTSAVVFLVRRGNPKQIRDWDDLVKAGVGVVTPNPKTSGGARWNYLAAWGFAERQYGSAEAARTFIEKLYANVAVLDSGARGAATTFIERNVGDVLITWESEALLALRELGRDQFEIVLPSLTIEAEPPVALVDDVVDKRGTRDVAAAYLQFLYSDAAQQLAAKHFYRPRDRRLLEQRRAQFPQVALMHVDADFGGWQRVAATHFAAGGVFDQLYAPTRVARQ
jgi:sulfate/thiosulfate transport system substrate-binding protein